MSAAGWPSSGTTFWLAALAIADDPNELDDLTREVSGALGDTLVVAPTDCYEGLPGVAGDGYVLGAEGADRTTAETAAAATSHAAVFVARVTYVCPD